MEKSWKKRKQIEIDAPLSSYLPSTHPLSLSLSRTQNLCRAVNNKFSSTHHIHRPFLALGDRGDCFGTKCAQLTYIFINTRRELVWHPNTVPSRHTIHVPIYVYKACVFLTAGLAIGNSSQFL